MTLRLVIEHSPTPQRRADFTVTGGDVSIGRGAECDWQIEDAEMYVSRRHCIVSVRDGEYSVTDASRGGVFIDGAQTPLGTGKSAQIEHGTRIRLGDIVLRVEIERDVTQPIAAVAPGASDSALTFDGDDFFAPRAPTAPPSRRPETLPEPFDSGRRSALPAAETPGPVLPVFDDPFSLDPLTSPRPAMTQATVEAPRYQRGADSPGDAGAFFEPASEDRPPQDARGAIDLPASRSQSWPKPAEALPPEPAPRVVVRAVPAAATEPLRVPSRSETAFDLPDPSQIPSSPSATREPPVPGAAENDLILQAFMRGLGLDTSKLVAPPKTEADFEALGQRFRLLTEGLVHLLRTRAKEKGSVRVAQTVIGSSDVNPLKFLATTDDALAALLTARGKGYLSPEDAISGAFRDLSDHQMRTWVAVQSALRGMIDRFDPEAFEQEADADGTLKAILAGGRGARLWQLYRARYRELAKAAEERFLGEVGADFRDAYEGNKGDRQ